MSNWTDLFTLDGEDVVTVDEYQNRHNVQIDDPAVWWAEWMKTHRQLREHYDDKVFISTVFLGLWHSGGTFFETIVFRAKGGTPLFREPVLLGLRYETLAGALRGHDDAIIRFLGEEGE